MGAGPDHELLPSPRDFFLGRKRCVAELFAELFGRSFLPFPHFAVVNHHIMRVARSSPSISPNPTSRASYLNILLAQPPRQGTESCLITEPIADNP